MLDEVIGSFVAALGPDALTEFALTSLDRVDVPVWSVWWQAEGSATGGHRLWADRAASPGGGPG
jgi:hypothetical protein